MYPKLCLGDSSQGPLLSIDEDNAQRTTELSCLKSIYIVLLKVVEKGRRQYVAGGWVINITLNMNVVDVVLILNIEI